MNHRFETPEGARDERQSPWLDALLQDIRYAFRTLRNNAAFTTFAIIIAGVGIGASATVFSVFEALMLRPLPFRDPGSLVWIENNFDGGMSSKTLQVGNVIDFKAQNKSFSDVAGYFAFYGVGDSKLTGAGEPERLTSVPVTENFFQLLGVQPQIGRYFTREECQWRGPRAVILSHRFWERRFASNPKVVGQPITLDNEPVTVVGVLPESFDFGSIFAPGSRIDIFSAFPLSFQTNRWGNTMSLVGRLKPGVSIPSAQAEANMLGQRITNDHPQWNAIRPRLVDLGERVSGQFRFAIYVLIAAVMVVMMIVCANLSNLLLARTSAREKEIAIRVALGARRARLIRQMLTESVVLACAGAALGLFLALAGTRVLSGLEGINVPLLARVEVNGLALAFTIGVAVASGLIFGLGPALQVSALAPHSALKENSRGSSDSKHRNWVRGLLVSGEVALACVLLVGAGLLIRSFLELLEVKLGFEPGSAFAMRIDPSSDRNTPESRNAYMSEALRRTLEVPGVESAGLTDALPLGRNRTWGVGVKGKSYRRGEYPLAFVRVVSEGYLQSMRIPLIKGRELTENDGPRSEPVIVINETLARTLFPNEDPIGRTIRAAGERKVIGVVGDVRHLALDQRSGSEMYLPMRQIGDYPSVDLVVRGRDKAERLAGAVRAALRPLDPNLPANEFRTIQGLIDRSVSPRRFVMLVLAGFAGVALVLASLGIYAVISYSVNQRKQEIGIRMALGASPADVHRKILFETLKLAGGGMLVGIAASWAVARGLQGVLYGVKPSDPATFAGMLALLLIVALVAGYLPARRASRLDPTLALRGD